ncbi:MAG TPA: PilZ domain-containing protein [Myxococcales bacterium]|nr:PilZ domain-containing protein [Myxococcales bacterium]
MSPPTPVPAPVQLRVVYRNPRSMLGEFTRSVGRAAVVLETARPLPVGARFDFQLHALGVGLPVEVRGEVFHCAPAPAAPGRYQMAVRYDAAGDRRGLDAALQWLIDAHRDEKTREHPRVPLRFQGTDGSPDSPAYVVRDLSLGGAGVELEEGRLPAAVRPGAPFLLELEGSAPLVLHGEVAWVTLPRPGGNAWARPAFGARFGALRREAVERLEKLLELRGLPRPPWKARLSFAMDAVARMP